MLVERVPALLLNAAGSTLSGPSGEGAGVQADAAAAAGGRAATLLDLAKAGAAENGDNGGVG